MPGGRGDDDPSPTSSRTRTVVTDGPFLEAKEQLAGCLVLDCDTSERAAAIAARIPDARFGAVEIRSIMEMSARRGERTGSTRGGRGPAAPPGAAGLAAVVRYHGHFEIAEDAVQEALLAATARWTEHGVPESAEGWLIRVASRRVIDHLRTERASRQREQKIAALTPQDDLLAPPADAAGLEDDLEDDTFSLFMLCCHPSLTPPSQVALTLRAVGGLSTVEIARAFLVPEATMAQRFSRAKQRIRTAGARFALPPEAEWADRLGSVLHVLYLVFNEGYTVTAGPDLHRTN